MGKPRTKRQQVRDERKAKRKAAQEAGAEETTTRETKRRRTSDDEGQDDDRDHAETDGPRAAKRAHRNPDDDYVNDPFGTGADQGRPEREFFGMLDDEEQEYFKRADEMLELNQFPSDEDRDVFLQSVYREAVGKELKLASSQSLSRLMERLILLSSTRQKKHIFGAFAGHFLSLVQHRFASHCCEALFLQSAPVVTQELGATTAFVVDTAGQQAGDDDAAAAAEPENTMETLFLMTLDEFEEHLGYLLTDRFASHTLRVLLVVLSGRSLEDAATKTLLKSKKKERISVHGAPGAGHADEPTNQLRAVPASFTMATKKIIEDATAGMDFTALRILVKHPTGNPLLQLLLELDIALNHKSDKEKTAASDKATLLYRLLPGAPMSLANGDAQAADFVNSMVYDPIGSRILETLLTHGPGKIFRALHQNFFAPRMATYVRNDIASYPALRALQRLGKDDLVAAVHSILPAVPVLVAKARYNILKTLFQRCQVREAGPELAALTRALTAALGNNSKDVVPRLCYLGAAAGDAQDDKPRFQQEVQNKAAMASHGAQLAAVMLATPGSAAKASQGSLSSLTTDQLFELATRSMPHVAVLTTALAQPGATPVFHKALVGRLAPRAAELALTQFGHNAVNAIIAVGSVPFHVKGTIMAALAAREGEMRESWMGRSVWRTWKGDMWKTRHADWVRWAKEVDGGSAGAGGAEGEVKLKPWEKMREKNREKARARGAGGGGGSTEATTGANSVEVAEEAA
ncbi:Nucleolar protein 9 [Verticillium nonalfalfae]|uniref:Nucleolar protein 9 n=1 Tax=Verticillium nonalfalfae TaxID=1051616 RepID=A0A3M9YFM7_9PEZI|nr:Nucleolar protein 9 [Verticillium nonalfalfae]RNJ58881.1 Nucleolar protein 9 [Verticillium nonalfalfae]